MSQIWSRQLKNLVMLESCQIRLNTSGSRITLTRLTNRGKTEKRVRACDRVSLYFMDLMDTWLCVTSCHIFTLSFNERAICKISPLFPSARATGCDEVSRQTSPRRQWSHDCGDRVSRRGRGRQGGKVEKWNDAAGNYSVDWKLRKAVRWLHESDQTLSIKNNHAIDE